MNVSAILYILLALDCSGGFHGDLSSNAAAVIAVVLAVIAAIVDFKGTTRVG
jgi:hypothetical protein